MSRFSGKLVAQVALNAASFGYDRYYSYAVPEVWADTVRIGMRVAVPFGSGNRRRIAMILALTNEQPLSEDGTPLRLKPIAGVLDTEPVLNDELLSLVHFLHERTFCTRYDAVRAVLPGGMQIRLQEQFLPVTPPDGIRLSE